MYLSYSDTSICLPVIDIQPQKSLPFQVSFTPVSYSVQSFKFWRYTNRGMSLSEWPYFRVYLYCLNILSYCLTEI